MNTRQRKQIYQIAPAITYERLLLTLFNLNLQTGSFS